ncbi:MAG: DedA family protein [Candidatus Levybacteria bacterium]|nr:DedA family protein [Candidatus Levybacteria bacterium]
MIKIRQIINPTLFGPLILLFLYWGLIFFLRGKVPDAETFIESLKGLYGTYGYFLIFAAAIMEGMLVLGMYVPGSTVILMGAILARMGVVSYPLVFVLGTGGLLIGYSIDYFLGRFGWHHLLLRFGLEKGFKTAKEKLEKHDKKAIFLGFVFPGSASFLATSAGIIKMPFRKFIFLAILAQVFWGLFWGNLAYFFGLPILEYFQMKYFILLLLFIGIIWMVRKYLRKKN